MSEFNPVQGFVNAGPVGFDALDVYPLDPPPGRRRHPHGHGPFARLVMPEIPDAPGVYLIAVDNEVVYIGRSKTSMERRLGPEGFSIIRKSDTLTPQRHMTNGGRPTCCRINTLLNDAIGEERQVDIWVKLEPKERAETAKRQWLEVFGTPDWNLVPQRGER